MSTSSPPPPPLLIALSAIIPASWLHYSPHSIDLQSDLSICAHAQQGFMWTGRAALLWKS